MLTYTDFIKDIKDDLVEKCTQHSSSVDQNLATKKLATSNSCETLLKQIPILCANQFKVE